MANVDILSLPVATSIDGSEYVPLAQGNTTRRASAGLIMAGSASQSTQIANAVFAGPTSGAAATPTFRALVAADIPASAINIAVGATPIGSGTSGRVLYDNAGVLGEYSISGTGSVAMTNGPVFVTPTLGTPASGTLTNCIGLPISTGVSGLGTGIATALAVNVGSAGAPVLFNGALGTPASGTLTNATGLPITTGVAGLGSNVATFLATPSSANLAAAVSDETGSGALVFATSPTLVTPVLGTPASGTLTNCTGLPLTTGVTGVLAGANGGTGVANTGKTITVSGNTAIGSGSDTVAFVTAGATSVTLPTTGTLATLAGAESLSNKTLVSPVITTSPTAAGATWTDLGTVTTVALAAVTGTIDMGGATSLEIPNSNAPTVDADGEIAIDNSVADFAQGIVKYFSTAEMGVVAMPVAQFGSPSNGAVPTYNASNDRFELTVPAGSGDVVGPGSATDHAVARFDSTTGKLIQNSVLIVADTTGNISGPERISLGTAGAALGSVQVSGNTSGTITIQPQAAAGTFNFNLPTTAGSADQFLTSQGGGATAMTWTTPLSSITPGNGLTSTLTATAPGSAVTTTGTLSAAQLINAQTGTSYAILDGDRAKLITASNAAAQAYSVAQAGAASAFQAGWWVDISNISTNPLGVVTITPTTSTINGAATLVVQKGQSVRIVSNGSNYQASLLTGIRTVKIQTFSASGTYTPSTGMLHAVIEAIGGGAGGGGVAICTGGTINGAGGGGAGSYARKVVTAVQVGASQTVTIGAGGSGGAAGANAGIAGGDTSVGTLCIGKGGSGGAGAPDGAAGAGGAGGVAGTGDVTIVGGNGIAGSRSTNATFIFTFLSGGCSVWGQGGLISVNTNGSVGTGYGSGGGGGSDFSATSTHTGGAGAGGYVLITEHCTS